nr:PAAR domain-containing protein [Massilia sp. JS1662]
MRNRVIRVGDLTSQGGKVPASSAPHFTVDGIAVALAGAPCTCPSGTAHRSTDVTDSTGETNVIEDHYSRRQNRSWRHSN